MNTSFTYFLIWFNLVINCEFTLLQLPGQIDPDVLGSSIQRPQGYAGLNEQLLTQLTYQIADSDKKVYPYDRFSKLLLLMKIASAR